MRLVRLEPAGARVVAVGDDPERAVVLAVHLRLRALKERVQASPGLMGIRLYVDRRNTAAQRVYERTGMSREHYEMFEWMKG